MKGDKREKRNKQRASKDERQKVTQRKMPHRGRDKPSLKKTPK